MNLLKRLSALITVFLLVVQTDSAQYNPSFTVSPGPLSLGTALIVSGTPVALTNPITFNGVTPAAFMFLDSSSNALRIGSQGSSGYVNAVIECPSGSTLFADCALFTATLGSVPGTWQATHYLTSSYCINNQSPAVCGSSSAGMVIVYTSTSSIVVDTTAVTSHSQIFLQWDSSLGSNLAVTCSTTQINAQVSARSAGTSFTITLASAVSSNYACLSYQIVN